MVTLIKRIVPRSLVVKLCDTVVIHAIMKMRYVLFGRPQRQAETTKAYTRRVREHFFETYCNGRGLDIGYGGDLLTNSCRGWDFEDGDAQLLEGVSDNQYDFVYSSHTLEHMNRPELALKNWWRVVRPGGFLILYVPDRDLYEKRTTLPSRWNYGHKHFFLLDRDDPPDTIGLLPLVERSLSDSQLVYAHVCREGHTVTDPEVHSNGEYSLEIVLRKV